MTWRIRGSATFLAMVLWLRLYSVIKSGMTAIDKLETVGLGMMIQAVAGTYKYESLNVIYFILSG